MRKIPRQSISKVLMAALTLLILDFFCPGSAQAAIYYVSTQGDNTNPGTFNKPFGTLRRGIDAAGAGDTVFVRAGTYHEAVSVTQSGTREAPITISGYPGERPVLDGEYKRPSGTIGGTNPTDPSRYFVWEALVRIEGDYILFQRFELMHSLGRGITVCRNKTDRNHDNQINDCWTHDNRMEGIVLYQTDHALVQNCRVSVSGDFLPQTDRHGANWPGSLIARYVTLAVFRKNVVFHNWGEGIMPMSSEHITIEDNVVYDNFAVNIYCERTSDVLVQRNIVYGTNDGVFLRGGSPCPGIGFADEPDNQPGYTKNITVINNLMLGNSENFFWWGGTGEGGLINSLIAHNTLVNAHVNPGAAREARGMEIDAGIHTNCRIENNIILQKEGIIAAVDGQAKVSIKYSKNLWSRTPGWSEASDPNNRIGDPQLEMTGPTGPALLTPDYFKIKKSSPAKDAAGALSEVPKDFFGKGREGEPDIGAHEFGSP